MSISELTAIVPPPDGAEKPSRKIWKSIESKLQVTLPKDLNDIVSTYGSGTFVDKGRHWIKIYNPCSAEYPEEIITHRTNLEAFKAGEGDDFVPYPVFPSKPGLLACGSDANANEIYWLTEGKPEDWSIVIRTPSNEYEQFRGPLSSFLAKVFRREITVEAWPTTFFMHPENLQFDPAQPPAPKAPPRTIYELYVANGNQAGFWARRVDSQAGFKLLIREIDGKTSGTLPGIPVEYNRVPVTADLYLGKTLHRQNVDMSTGWHQMYEFFNWR